MNIQETVLNILEDITGTDEVVNNQDIQLFEEGLLDSLATVQLLVEIEGQLGIPVPVSDFDREVWGTPKPIIPIMKVGIKSNQVPFKMIIKVLLTIPAEIIFQI